METLFYEGVLPMARKQKKVRAGPGRPSEYGEPLRLLSMNVPQSKFLEFDEMCKKLGISRPKGFILLLEHRNQNIIDLMAKVKKLEGLLEQEKEFTAHLIKENEKKDKIIEKLQEELEKKDKKIERLVLQLEKLKMEQLSKKGREARDLRDEIHQVLSTYNELKLLELFRHLGYSETGDALKKKAETFLKRWFVLEGKVFVSKELGIVLEPSEHVGMLGWKVRKLEVEA